MIPLLDRLSLKLIVGIGCALLLALLIHDRNHWKAKTTHYAGLLAGERAAHSATIANYRAAAERARREDADFVARTKARQTGINERIEDDFEVRLAAARAAARRLRDAAAAATGPGTRRGALVPGLPAAAKVAAQAAGENGLPDPGYCPPVAAVPLGPADALIATEQAIQLDALIAWTKAQAGVEASREGGDRP